MRKAKTTKAKSTKKAIGAKGASKFAKTSGKTGLRRVRLKGNKQSSAKKRRDLQSSAYPLGGGGLKSTPEAKLGHGKTYMSVRMSDTARVSSDSMIKLYRISQRY